MSLKEEMVNVEIMWDKLNQMAKGEKVSPYTYLIQRGESIKEGGFWMKSMEFMTFYTSTDWVKSKQIVMILGIYPTGEIDSIIENEPYLLRRAGGDGLLRELVYWKDSNRGVQFIATTTTDGWSKMGGVKYQLGLKNSFINWPNDNPLEVKE